MKTGDGMSPTLLRESTFPFGPLTTFFVDWTHTAECGGIYTKGNDVLQYLCAEKRTVAE